MTGVGGVGKTRLALPGRARRRAGLPRGVWFVELAAVEDPDMLAQIVVEALDIRDNRLSSPVEVLTEHLRTGRQH
ncbi:hypothetical protein GCM10020219_055140 [Nonomuraea dietziae]